MELDQKINRQKNQKSEVSFEVVAPAFNEADSLQELIRRFAIAAKDAGFSEDTFSLVIVNNGSSDDSRNTLSKIMQTDLGNWFRVIDLKENLDYGHGIWSGLETTQAKYIGYTHADLQCDPRNVFKAYQKLMLSSSDKTLVKGKRNGRNWKDVTVTRIFETLANQILRLDVQEINAQPKVFPQKLLSFITDPPRTFAFDLYLLFMARKNGFLIEEIEVSFPPRRHGISKWAATTLGRYRTILGIINYILKLRKSEGSI